jgi:hypothetical protein
MADNSNHGTLRSRDSTASIATRTEIDAYLASIRKHHSVASTGQLIFGLDATASRQPTWDTPRQAACHQVRSACSRGLSMD